jgi:hypothetical protein
MVSFFDGLEKRLSNFSEEGLSMNRYPYGFVIGLLCTMLITDVCWAQWAGVGPRWTYNGRETMYVGILQTTGQEGFSFAYAWGPYGSNGAIEMWPDTYFKSGYVAVKNPSNASRTVAILDVATSDAGYAGFYDRYLEPTVTISTMSSDHLSGGIWVSDNHATPVYSAGINGRTGDVWGRTKSFIVPHPQNENLMIRYTALEGPEAAMYTRGTINLASGNAYVSLPEHFAVMANPSSITVSLTPRAAESKGVAAVEVTGQGFRVVELFQGTGNYSVDYLVHALRSGYENQDVYLSRTRENQALSFTADGKVPSESFEDYLPSSAPRQPKAYLK